MEQGAATLARVQGGAEGRKGGSTFIDVLLVELRHHVDSRSRHRYRRLSRTVRPDKSQRKSNGLRAAKGTDCSKQQWDPCCSVAAVWLMPYPVPSCRTFASARKTVVSETGAVSELAPHTVGLQRFGRRLVTGTVGTLGTRRAHGTSHCSGPGTQTARHDVPLATEQRVTARNRNRKSEAVAVKSPSVQVRGPPTGRCLGAACDSQ